MNYPVVIHKDQKSHYGVTVPDLPGCFTAGRTIDEALAMAKEAIALHVQGLIEEAESSGCFGMLFPNPDKNGPPRPPRAWQFFRAGGEIDGIIAGAKRMLGLGNSHRGGPPGFIATPSAIKTGKPLGGAGPWRYDFRPVRL